MFFTPMSKLTIILSQSLKQPTPPKHRHFIALKRHGVSVCHLSQRTMAIFV